MIPVALVGFLLTLKIWNAKPTRTTPAATPSASPAADDNQTAK
jgi:hypothetical protein